MAGKGIVKKKEEREEGAPAYMVTWGDMMGLLLTFFVLLLSMSDMNPSKFEKAISSYLAYMGFEPRFPTSPEEPNEIVPVPMLDVAHFKMLEGPNIMVRGQQDATQITISGEVLFEEGSEAIRGEARPLLDQVAGMLRGYIMVLNVRGHTSGRELRTSRFTDVWELSYARAREVAKYLQGQGLPEAQFLITACGENENVASDIFPSESARNRRVEVKVLSTEHSDISAAAGEKTTKETPQR